MANLYPQLALVTDAIAASMENNLIASKLMRWRTQSDSPIAATNRLKYIERVPPRYNTRVWTDTVSTLAGGKQDTVFGAEIFVLDSGITLDFTYEDFAHIRDEDMAARDERLRMIGQNAGERVDASVLNTLVAGGNNWIGTPGESVDTIEALIGGYVRAKEEGVPDEDMFAVLSYSDLGPLSKYLVETVTANRDTQEGILARLGNSPRLKELVGLKVMFTQQLPVLTTGTRTNGAVNGAAQGSNYSAVSQSTSTNGNFLTQTIAVDGLGANATIADGEVFTIAGVFAYDNRKGASLGRLQQFRVIGAQTATAGGAIAAMRIFPAIIAPSGTLIGDPGVNNANATVTAVPADDAVVTFLGTASTSYTQRAVVARSAVRVESANLEDLPSGENARRKMKSVPLTLRAHRYSSGDTATTSVRFDASYKANMEAFGRFKTIRINGTA